jgi:hypothetical protein
MPAVEVVSRLHRKDVGLIIPGRYFTIIPDVLIHSMILPE